MLYNYYVDSSITRVTSLVLRGILANLAGQNALKYSDRSFFWHSLAEGALLTAGCQIGASLINPDSSLGGSPDSTIKAAFVFAGKLTRFVTDVVAHNTFAVAGVFILRSYIRSEPSACLIDKQNHEELAVEIQDKT